MSGKVVRSNVGKNLGDIKLQGNEKYSSDF